MIKVVVPEEAGISGRKVAGLAEIPAYAGMTVNL